MSCFGYYITLGYYFLPRAQAIGNGWGCLSYLSGVKISDLVPFTVSQTSVDYQRPSWYLVGCFSLNKIPEISITKTTLIIWLEPQGTSIKEFLFLGFFNFLCLNCYFLGVDISWCPSHTDKTYIYIGVVFEIPGILALLCIGVPRGVLIYAAHKILMWFSVKG